jgi:APA family basic amino acid/polyamine antiporter
VAILFASYVDRSFVPLGPGGVRVVAGLALATLTLVNVAGVRAGKHTNNILMAAKVGGILALLALVFAGVRAPASDLVLPVLTVPAAASVSLLFTALVPILFAYGGWQSCGSLAAEIKDPSRNLARANVIGVVVVITLYLALNIAYLWAFSPAAIAASPALAADVARHVAGEAGARFVAFLIVISSLGFLGVVIITGPRLYYAMARDGLFLPRAGRLHPRYQTPVFALWFQAGVSLALLATNTYDQLLSYVVFADWLFFGLTAGALFILRRRGPAPPDTVRAPGHPVTTGAFVLVAAGVVLNSFVAYPVQSAIGTVILLAAAGAYGLVSGRMPA